MPEPSVLSTQVVAPSTLVSPDHAPYRLAWAPQDAFGLVGLMHLAFPAHLV
jgi:hypothetical protein